MYRQGSERVGRRSGITCEIGLLGNINSSSQYDRSRCYVAHGMLREVQSSIDGSINRICHKGAEDTTGQGVCEL